MRIINHLKSNENSLLLLLLLGLWAILNLFTAAYTDLTADESYYWVISKELLWGYYDHPPLSALLLRCGTFLFGDTELGVRFFTILLHYATLALFWFVIRTPKSNYITALKYFVICFSLPLLHVYGFVATPDAPLMFAIVLTLWAYKKFANSAVYTQANYFSSIAFLALGFALMAYAKYHGALVVIAIVLSRPKLLIDWRFYAAGLLAAAIYLPHFWWQWQHDFVSFEYHLNGRKDPFQWRYVSEYLLNFFGAYNPFLTIPFFAILIRSNPFVKAPLERYFRVSSIFILFVFLYSTGGGHVQAQWMLPLIFPIVFFMLKRSERSEWFAKYVWWTCGVFGALLMIVQIALISVPAQLLPSIELRGVVSHVQQAALNFNGNADENTIENNEKSEEGSSTSSATIAALILEGRYHHASTFNFYTDLPTYAMPSVYWRSSHYEFMDTPTDLYGKRVAQEISSLIRIRTPQEELFEKYKSITVPTMGTIFYEVVDSYIPTKNVSIEVQGLPEKVLTEQELALTLVLTNPYDFDIEVGAGEGAFGIFINMHNSDRTVWYDLPIEVKPVVLGRKSSATITAYVTIPEFETDDYVVGFSLMRSPFATWYNSRVFSLMIVNPKTRV